jgi:hypothetical protein
MARLTLEAIGALEQGSSLAAPAVSRCRANYAWAPISSAVAPGRTLLRNGGLGKRLGPGNPGQNRLTPARRDKASPFKQ